MSKTQTTAIRRPQATRSPIELVQSRLSIPAAVVLLLALLAARCEAVVVLVKGQDEPIRGYLVSENTKQVVINQVLPGGRLKRIEIARDRIEELLKAVDPERLSELGADNPTGYRDYAEILSAREDPDAKVTALRLYLIAAYLNPRELGRGSLLGMARLARNSREERAFRALAYLLDPDHDSSVLTDPAVNTPAGGTVPDAEQRDRLLKAVRALRGGRKTEAKNRAKIPQFQQWLEPYKGLITIAEFREEAAKSDPAISAKLLSRLITLELALLESEAAGAGPKDNDAPWSQLSPKNLRQPVLPLRLETVTEFDPRKWSYQGGKWVEP